MKNFDAFVGIDWSGAISPQKSRSIALAIAWRGTESPHISGKCWTRSMIADWICSMAERNKRILIGIDCNFGYAQAMVQHHTGQGGCAKDLWNKVDDICYDDAEYYAGSFWKTEPFARDFWISGKKPQDKSFPMRITEELCRAAGLGAPESPFKLIGPKQVGKGGLAGMRMLHDLQKRLGERLAIFPFEQDMQAYGHATLVVAEIYPRLFLKRAGWGGAKVRTIEGLNHILAALGSEPSHDIPDFSDHDADALCAAAGLRFLCQNDTTIPVKYSRPPAPVAILRSEGWIFGVCDEKGTKAL